MRASPKDLSFFVPIVLLLCSVQTTAQSQGDVDYNRAERFLSWNLSPMIGGDEVDPEWMSDGNRFWYRNKTLAGHEFVLIDPVRNTRNIVFDNARLAAAMSLANDTTYDPVKLPFETFKFVDTERTIEITASDRLFRCELAGYVCSARDTLPSDLPYVVSPDSVWEAFIHDYNLHIRPTGGGDSIQLTSDGVQYWSYGLGAPRPFSLLNGGDPQRPTLYWSPDSRKIAVERVDERDVEHMHYISSTSQRPSHFSQPYALPADSILPVPGLHIVTIGPGGAEANVRAELAPTLVSISLSGSAADSCWSNGGDRIHVDALSRGSKSTYLIEVDASTGESQFLARDTSQTFVELGQRGPSSWYVTEGSQDVIWWSERDGWAHLYRYDGNANIVNQVTSGPWAVATVWYVNEANSQIYFTARGREPDRLIYHAHLYRVGFDGSGLTLLTPEDADHEIEFSPSGRYFVDSYSRVDMPPTTVVRSAVDGRVVSTLEQADVSRLAEIGWEPPRVFTVKARDGITDLYGVMYLPSDLDSTKQYPLIEYIYPGPQRGSLTSWGFKVGRRGDEAVYALSQLGFVVIQLDHQGTPWRSKAFHDFYYGNMGDNGIPDHIAAIKQLGARFPFIDLDRVGIYGHSGGGFASTDAIMRYPDFYKVAVSTAGNHDNRSYHAGWGEKYQGLFVRDSASGTDNFENQVNALLVENLRGKLLLVHGDMDDNVHPAMTIQVVDALIKANKDFDLLIMPDRDHGLNDPYVIRRRWDYFVRHLLGVEPPKEFRIVRPEN